MKRHVFTGLAILFTVISTTTFAALEREAAGWLVFLVGVFATLAVRLSDVTELTVGPLRAKLERAISEANATVDQLRRLAAALAKGHLAQSVDSNFWGGMSVEARLRNDEEVRQMLVHLGVSETLRREAEEQWRDGVKVLFFRTLKNAIGDSTKECKAIAGEWQKQFDEENWKAPSAEKSRGFFVEKQVLSTPAEQLLDDYAHFERTGEIRAAARLN